MKKTLITMTMLAGAVSVYSQTVSFNDYNGSFEIQVFGAQSTAASTVSMAYAGMAGWFEEQGNNSNTYNPAASTKVYSGSPITTTIGNTTWDAELYATAGTSATTLSQLAALSSTLTSSWYPLTAGSGPNSDGSWASTAIASVSGASSGTATFAIAVWKNTGGSGAATTLAQAQADGYSWGVSDIATGTVATGDEGSGFLPQGLTDFSMAVSTPEPSTIALGVLGASALLFRRRK